MKRSEWLFPSLFLGLLVLGYGVVPLPRAREGADSYAVDRGGKKAFFDLTGRLLPDVRRSSGSLVPEDPETDVLVLLGPARYPERAQWQTLHDWVSQGRALVFAAKWQDPAVDLAPFGIEVVPNFERDEEEAAEEPVGAEEEAAEASAVETELVEGSVDWRSFGHVRFASAEASVELAWRGMPQVVWQPVGQGVVIVAASDFVFSNLSMTKPENGLLAFRILELGAPSGPVAFDEGMNEAGAPKIVGLLFEPPFRLPTLQILIVTLLFGWMSSRRFGPVLTRSRPERRSLVEHAEALGVLHYRVGTGGSLVQSYLEHFGRELGLRYRSPADELSRGSSADPIARALRAAKSPVLDRGRLASVITALARLRVNRAEGKSQDELERGATGKLS